MFRISLSIAISIISSAAFAHIGHVETVSGHSHYVGYGALIIAAAIAVHGLLKIKRTRNV